MSFMSFTTLVRDWLKEGALLKKRGESLTRVVSALLKRASEMEYEAVNRRFPSEKDKRKLLH